MGIPCNCLILRFCLVCEWKFKSFLVFVLWGFAILVPFGGEMFWSHGFFFWVDGVFQFWYSKWKL
jgi:hypothetical protein